MTYADSFCSLGRPPLRISWRETWWVVLFGTALLAILNAPAFRAYFFAENFVYWGQYVTHHSSLWESLTTPTGAGFRYQPVFFLFGWPWHYFLPLAPFAYHLRNFLFVVVNITLLHRLLLRLVQSRVARLTGVGFFAVSKINLTTIGYLNIFDSIILLTLLLITLLFLIRFIDQGRLVDYAVALLGCGLSIFSKDYGLVVVGVIAAYLVTVFLSLAATRRRIFLNRVVAIFLPGLLLSLFYLHLHSKIAGSLSSSDPVYAPRLDLGWMALKSLLFGLTLANQAPWPSGVMGVSSFGHWFDLSLPSIKQMLPSELCVALSVLNLGDSLLFVGFLFLVGVTLVRARKDWKVLIFPLIWIALYLGPTLLVRNVQIYYNHESMAGFAVLIALALERARRDLQILWITALAAIGLSALSSNWRSGTSYTWAAEAAAAQKAERAVIRYKPGKQIESLTFITNPSTRSFWIFTLGSKAFPMFPALLHRPNLVVSYAGYGELPSYLHRADSSHPVFDIENGFLSYPQELHPPLVFDSLAPDSAVKDHGFNVQPGNVSALVATAKSASPNTAIIFDEIPLASRYNNPTCVTALVPSKLMERIGEHEVYLDDGVRKSNRLPFEVLATAPKNPAGATNKELSPVEWPQASAIPKAAPTLSANPNPVPRPQKGLGVTTIRWDTGDNSWGAVYVSANGGPEQLLANGPAGSAEANWIQPGVSYDFKLYQDSSFGPLKKTVRVVMSP